MPCEQRSCATSVGPTKLASIKDSALGTMTDGNDNFQTLKQVRNLTILAVATSILDKSDLPSSLAEAYTKDLIKKLGDA